MPEMKEIFPMAHPWEESFHQTTKEVDPMAHITMNGTFVPTIIMIMGAMEGITGVVATEMIISQGKTTPLTIVLLLKHLLKTFTTVDHPRAAHQPKDTTILGLNTTTIMIVIGKMIAATTIAKREITTLTTIVIFNLQGTMIASVPMRAGTTDTMTEGLKGDMGTTITTSVIRGSSVVFFSNCRYIL